MIKMDRPNLVARDVFATCISRIRDRALKKRMVDVTDLVVTASEEFDNLASQNRLFEIVRQDNVGGLVTKAEMEAVYKQRMAKKDAPGRAAYDELINSAPQGKCPLCGQRTVSTLDHHLPKTHYPALTVIPLNLVPVCSDCNKSKLDSFPANASEEPLHPYYDNIQKDRWLYAKVVEKSPTALQFYVEAPSHWNNILADRVASHFRRLNLGALYAAEAADELLNIRHQLQLLHEHGGSILVEIEMNDRAVSCRNARLNSWRTATFEAFAMSRWFCNGGFDLGVCRTFPAGGFADFISSDANKSA